MNKAQREDGNKINEGVLQVMNWNLMNFFMKIMQTDPKVPEFKGMLTVMRLRS